MTPTYVVGFRPEYAYPYPTTVFHSRGDLWLYALLCRGPVPFQFGWVERLRSAGRRLEPRGPCPAPAIQVWPLAAAGRALVYYPRWRLYAPCTSADNPPTCGGGSCPP